MKQPNLREINDVYAKNHSDNLLRDIDLNHTLRLIPLISKWINISIDMYPDKTFYIIQSLMDFQKIKFNSSIYEC